MEQSTEYFSWRGSPRLLARVIEIAREEVCASGSECKPKVEFTITSSTGDTENYSTAGDFLSRATPEGLADFALVSASVSDGEFTVEVKLGRAKPTQKLRGYRDRVVLTVRSPDRERAATIAHATERVLRRGHRRWADARHWRSVMDQSRRSRVASSAVSVAVAVAPMLLGAALGIALLRAGDVLVPELHVPHGAPRALVIGVVSGTYQAALAILLPAVELSERGSGRIEAVVKWTLVSLAGIAIADLTRAL